MPLTDAPNQAELAEAQARRAAVGRRADQIRRRRTGAIAGLVAVLVLAVAVPLALTRSTNRSEGVVTTVPPSPTTTNATPSTIAGAVTSTTATTTPVLPGTPLTFGAVRLVVPHGWVSDGHRCIQPASARITDGLADCPGGIIVTSPDGTPTLPLEGVTSGHLEWDNGTGMDCPFGNSTGSKHMGAPEVASGFRPVGTVTAEWEEWAATCTHGPVNHVQAWFLPQSNVLFISASTSPGIAQILASVRPLSVAELPTLTAVGRWGGRGTSLRMNPDGVGVLIWRTYRQCSATVTYPCDSPSDRESTYAAWFTLTSVQSGAAGSWSGVGHISGGSDAPSWLGYNAPVHVTQIGGVVTITGGGGFVAGTYPNGQLCSASLRGGATNGGCP